MDRLGSGNREFSSANARDRCACGSAGDLDTTGGAVYQGRETKRIGNKCQQGQSLHDSPL